jgi:hypothetical protein
MMNWLHVHVVYNMHACRIALCVVALLVSSFQQWHCVSKCIFRQLVENISSVRAGHK